MKNLSVFNQLSIISPISFWHSFGAFKVWTVTRRIFFFYGMHGTNSKKHLKKNPKPWNFRLKTTNDSRKVILTEKLENLGFE